MLVKLTFEYIIDYYYIGDDIISCKILVNLKKKKPAQERFC